MKQLHWGRTKSGKPAAPYGIVAGLVGGALVGLIYWLLNRSDPQAWMVALAIGAASIPFGFGLGLVFLVDRNTLKGAVPRPEESVEALWFTEAGYWAFLVVMTAISLFGMAATMLPSLRDMHFHQQWLWVIVVLGWASLGVSYLIIKRRES